jgi:hypothetical protein
MKAYHLIDHVKTITISPEKIIQTL